MAVTFLVGLRISKLKKQILIVPAIKQGIESQDGFEIFQGNWPSISSVCCPLISLDFDELGTGNVVVEAELRTDSSDCFKDSRIALCVHLCVIPGIIHQSEVFSTIWSGAEERPCYRGTFELQEQE